MHLTTIRLELTESGCDDVADGTDDGQRAIHDRDRLTKTVVRVVHVDVAVEVFHTHRSLDHFDRM